MGLIIALAALGMSATGIGRIIINWKESSGITVVWLLMAALACWISISWAFTSDFVSTTGAIPYTGNQPLYGIFLGAALLDVGCAMVAAIATFKTIKLRKHYPHLASS